MFSYALDDNGQVWAWGTNDEGQLGDGLRDTEYESNADSAVPVQVSQMSDAIAIAAGNLAGYALKSDGTVWTWGYDDVTGKNSLVPVQVPDLTSIIAIAAEPYSGYALDDNGHVWAWGENGGALGNGSTVNSDVPVEVSGLPYVKAIAANGFGGTAYALDSNGSVWAWGSGNGALGNGSTANSDVPVQVSNLTTVKAIAAGMENGYALTSDGSVWAWGNNFCGQLGSSFVSIGISYNSLIPVQVSNLSGVKAISSGSLSGYALKSDGTVWAWGNNGENELGNGAGGYNTDGSSKNSAVPVQVSNLSGVTAVFGGWASGYAIDDNGNVWAWGGTGYSHEASYLGNASTTTGSPVPVQITSLNLLVPVQTPTTLAPVINTPVYAGATSVGGTAAPDASIVLSVNGTAQTAVDADGNGSWTVSVPALSAGTGISVTAQAAGELISAPAEATAIAAVTVTSVNNPAAITVDNDTDLAYAGLPSTVEVNLSDGSSPSVDVTWDGGSPAYDGNTAGSYTFTGTLTLPGSVTNPNNLTASVTVTVQAPAPVEPALAAGNGTAYALDAGGSVWAWGWNAAGQLGNGTSSGTDNSAHSALPVRVSNLSGVKAIAAGEASAYALKEDGTVWGWGSDPDDELGKLGNNTSGFNSVPVQVYGLNDIKAIAGGGMAAYALQQNGTLWAWGDGSYGQLGNGLRNEVSATPVQVTGLGGLKIVAIAAGYYSAYALDSTGQVWAWGWNYIGQLGNENIPAGGSPVPVKVDNMADATAIAAGQSVAFALDSNGHVWGWGRNGNGELGMNPIEQGRAEPVQILGLSSIKAIAASWALTAYALDSSGHVWAWGNAFEGVLGNGNSGAAGNYSAYPVQVSNLSGITAIAAGYALDGSGNAWAWGPGYYGQLGNDTDMNSGGSGYSIIPVQVSGLNLGSQQQLGKATPSVSSPNVLANGTVLVYTTVTNEDGSLDTAGDASVSVAVTGVANPVTLKDDGSGGDQVAGDGVYSAWVNIPGPGPATINLTVNGEDESSTTVNVISDPTLAVCTNLSALYKEFLNTGMSPREDLDGNGVPDFYDLLARLNQYAGAHHGIVFDLAQEITAANGYSQDYSSLRYGADDVAMGKLIDDFTNNLGTGHSVKDIAIVGDDSVVPFYRRPDPPNTGEPESDYPSNTPGDLGSDYGNPTLIDSGANYIMTDVPYACFGINPDTSSFPMVEAGIGRIFADHPGQLAQIIDGYETPVDLNPVTRTAEVFNLHDETKDNPPLVNWPNAVKLALKPVLDKYFRLTTGSPVILPDQYFQKNGQVMGWAPGSVASSLQQADITLLWSHATHEFQFTEPEEGPAIVPGTYSGIPVSEPGHMVISTGCHSGYSVGRVSTRGNYTPYDQSLVKSLLAKEITYLAPTTYGIGDEKHGVAYHDLLLSSFLGDILNANTRTVGDAQIQAYGQYWARTESGGYMDNTSTYAAFGTELYGLPTQPVDPPSQTLQPAGGGSGINKDVRSASGDSSLSFSVDTPNFQVTTDDQGNALFQVPGDNSFMVNAFAPYIPLVQKSILLPAGATVNNITLDPSSVVSSVYQGEVSLETETPVNETSGPLQGSFAMPNPYPDKNFWWSTAPADGGVVLTVSVAPMQYDPDTRQVTLFNHMSFDVDYSIPTASASIDSVQVNNGSPLATGLASAPVTVGLSSSSAQTATLLWEARDRSGNLLDSGNGNLQLASGTNTYDFTLNTGAFGPGPSDLTVALSVSGSIYASQTVTMMVYGIGLDASMDQDVYTAGATGSASVTVWDETGAPVNGLATSNFTAMVDGTSVSASVYAGGDGACTLSFPIGVTGQHTLEVDCTDSRGMQASTSLDYAVAAETTQPGTLAAPVISPGSGSYTSAQTVSITNPNPTSVSESVYYTMNGSSPTVGGSLYYAGPFLLSSSATVQAAVYDHTLGWSGIATASIVIRYPSSGGGRGAAPVNNTGTATLIPATGGTVWLGSEAAVTIPRGALAGSSPLIITVQKDASPPATPSGFMLLSSVYRCTIGGADHYTFNSPVTLTFTFDPSKIPTGETPAIYYYDDAAKQWVNIGGTVNLTGDTITVTVDHFTEYAVFASNTPQTPATTKPTAPSFSDVSSSYWGYDAISNLGSKGIVSGYPDGSFRPGNQITRAEFATMLVKAIDPNTAGTTGQFTDVTASDWYYNFVNTADYDGLVSGMGNNLFAPNALITREQMAVMVTKVLGAKASAVDGAELNFFSDKSAVSSWAVSGMEEAVKTGIVHGMAAGLLAPQADANRGQAAVMVYRLLGVLGK
jgi:alpha-tubulin suppressor-like RCC1 family protein